jgi:hypothetical protein
MFDFRREVRRFEDSLVRAVGGVVVCESFGAYLFFGQEFDGGAEEVLEKSPFVGIIEMV